MVVSDAAGLLILGLAATTGGFLALGWSLRWDLVLARLAGRGRARFGSPVAAGDAAHDEAPELALEAGSR